jgi:glucosamine-6-phosphate deaminase
MNRGKEIHELLKLTPEQMLEKAKGKLEILPDLDELHQHFARDIADTIINNNKTNKPTILIVPFGPVPQYPLFVDIINNENISLKNCKFFFMDENCDMNGRVVSVDHPESFQGGMKDIWPKMKDELRIPAENVIFPSHQNMHSIEEWIDEAGGIETCYGGIGIHGHVAFNEPEYGIKWTGPRMVNLNNFTITINAIRSGIGGDLENFPRKAITIGMQQVLNAKKIRLYCRNDIPGIQWANTVLRLAVFGTPGDDYPVTHIRDHADWKIITDMNTAAPAEHVLEYWGE